MKTIHENQVEEMKVKAEKAIGHSRNVSKKLKEKLSSIGFTYTKISASKKDVFGMVPCKIYVKELNNSFLKGKYLMVSAGAPLKVRHACVIKIENNIFPAVDTKINIANTDEYSIGDAGNLFFNKKIVYVKKPNKDGNRCDGCIFYNEFLSCKRLREYITGDKECPEEYYYKFEKSWQSITKEDLKNIKPGEELKSKRNDKIYIYDYMRKCGKNIIVHLKEDDDYDFSIEYELFMILK